MKRFRYSIILFIISILTITAQSNADAEKVINNLLLSAKTNAIKTNFTLSVSQKNAVNSQSSSGTFTIKDNKFVLEMNDLKAWYDGKTQWTFTKETNEVSITEPTESELAETNPMSILKAYKAKSNLNFSKTVSKQNYIVEMIPKLKKDDFKKIEVQINKTNGNLVSIKIFTMKGTNTTLLVSNYQQAIKLSDDAFTFNKNKYKGIYVNDLR